ncbi:MAG: hypothetical protein AAF518_25745 [Spirochaetota bacterium]
MDSNKYKGGQRIVPGNSQKAKDSQKELTFPNQQMPEQGHLDWKVKDLQQADYHKSIADQNKDDWKYTTAASNYRKALDLYCRWLPKSDPRVKNSQKGLVDSNKYKGGQRDEG